MKLLLTTILFTVSSFVFGALMQLHGNFKGDNLIIRNPFIKAENKYSISSIVINEKKIDIDLNHHTVEIIFDSYKIPLNAVVDIRIYYTPQFQPEVVNPTAIKTKTLFAFNNISIKEKNIKITTRGEQPESKIEIQRLENDEWVTVSENKTLGGRSTNYYDFPIKHLSGTTKLRLAYKQTDDFIEYSGEYTYKSNQTPVNFYPSKVKDKITFINNNKQPVKYVIYDLNGKVIDSGTGTEIDCTGLTVKSVYTLSFDNQKKVFQKVKNK